VGLTKYVNWVYVKNVQVIPIVKQVLAVKMINVLINALSPNVGLIKFVNQEFVNKKLNVYQMEIVKMDSLAKIKNVLISVS
jgi:hypothetical protein